MPPETGRLRIDAILENSFPMDDLRLPKHKEKIGYRGNTYAVETEYDLLLDRVSVRLFKNRRLVSSRSIKIRNAQSEKTLNRTETERIKEQISYYHREEYALLLSLFDLSQKLKLAGDGPSHHSLGLVFLGRELLEEAKEEFLTALVKTPNYSLVYNHLGIIYLKLGMVDESIKSFQSALKINPDFADYHHNLGNAFLEKKDYLGAEKEFKEALRLNPRYQELYLNLGYSCLERGREDGDINTDTILKEALDNFKRAYQYGLNKDLRMEEFLERAFNWEDLSRIYMLLRSLLTEGSSLDIKSLCEYFRLRFKYDPKAVEKKEVEDYLLQLSREIVEGKNYPDLRYALALSYIFYSRYFLKLAEKQFQRCVQSVKDKSPEENNFKITGELKKKVEEFLEEVEIKG
jgi:tetratricopeptide (TPR) repeat protein